jgi:hypothetical protein
VIVKCRCVRCFVLVELPIEEFRERLARSELIADYDKTNIALLCEPCSEDQLNEQARQS